MPIKKNIDDINHTIDKKIDLKNIKLKKKKIIVVDDNVALADVLGKLLRVLNQEVTPMYSGASVIERVRTEKPDIIFIDIAMPSMSGYELIEILRQDPSLKKTKFIALSGFGEEYRQKSLEAGFDDHLIKPVGLAELQKVLS